MSTITTSAPRSIFTDPRLLLFILLGAVVLAYANTLEWVADFWQRPEYSHGYLIPAFACALLWLRRPDPDAKLPENEQRLGLALVAIGVVGMLMVAFMPIDKYYPAPLHNLLFAGSLAFFPCLAGAVVLAGKDALQEATATERWIGVGIIILGLALRLVLTWYSLITPEMLTLLVCLTGAFMVAGGTRALTWALPAVLFLVFMFPLPDVLERGMLAPLQRFATIASTFCLQLIGLPAYREGYSIHIGENQLGVIDECSGLRMLTIFFAMSVAITMVINRPMWERVVIVLSALPIALAVNVARITITAILYQVADAELAHKVFHDGAGLIMMPMALGLLYCELQILSHLVEEDEDLADDYSDSGVGQHLTPVA
ncbi:MAG: exosortase/archaeosortase family protein [Pirellulales bacterium]|nr:exosortase/archaeosortase family protein [Pirellulales bacterium]